MTTARRVAPIALASTLAGVALFALIGFPRAERAGPSKPTPAPTPIPGPGPTGLPDPSSLPRPSMIAIDPRSFEDGGFRIASQHTGPIRDPNSLAELRDAIRSRGPNALAALTSAYRSLKLDDPPTPAQLAARCEAEKSLGLIHLYEGQFAEAADWLERAIADARASGIDPRVRGELMAIRGIASLRRGEVENCVACLGPSSCIYPIARSAAHRKPAGSLDAIRWFSDYLRESPNDLRVIWLLNLAYMTLGDDSARVPTQFRIPDGLFASRAYPGRFENVAQAVGLTSRGPNLAGGSVFDDFDGDGRPDLFTTSLDAGLGASLFLNRGGTFEDRSEESGLADQVYALNVARADYDNDGDLDVVLLRGGWEMPLRPSLLRNRGDGTFEDVTASAGLITPIQTEAAAWGDFDADGWLDLFVCGEYLTPGARTDSGQPLDPRNRCRLYRNLRDGTFEDVAARAGVLNERCAKGAAWGDFDADGDLDLYVSNMGQPGRLYRNDGAGHFEDVAGLLGVEGPSMGFACWFWDFDNDGRLDLYVNDYQAGLAEVLASAAGIDDGGRRRPRLYRNLGPAGFEDVTAAVGLARAMVPMGSNFGDVDNDGFLDVYLGTGGMSYEYLVPKQLFLNRGGRRFDEATVASGTGHLQKGHGVSFADFDGDGDLDLFCELGGAVPGDRSFNALFRNPGHGRHWIRVRLIGRSTNRSAIGARIRVDLRSADGSSRSIYRTVGNNSSFGGNSLIESIGLLDTARVESLTVDWPVSKTTQVFRDLAADLGLEITEDVDAYHAIVPSPR